jgi:hypothetical protein
VESVDTTNRPLPWSFLAFLSIILKFRMDLWLAIPSPFVYSVLSQRVLQPDLCSSLELKSMLFYNSGFLIVCAFFRDFLLPSRLIFPSFGSDHFPFSSSFRR